jgi:hypothetical protein
MEGQDDIKLLLYLKWNLITLMQGQDDIKLLLYFYVFIFKNSV